MKTKLFHSAAGCALTMALALPTAARAQDSQPAADQGIQEIIVTATKAATSANDTPIALSVIGANQLAQQGVHGAADLQNIAPSLNVGSAAHGASITIRGVGSTDTTSKGTQGVSFNIDGVPIGRPQLMSLAFLDLERVEVLRGPQGTLYGKSSTGGAINLVTAKPKDELEGSASFELGSYNTRRGEAMINVPVTDFFAIRAAAAFNSRNGFIKPVLGDTGTLKSSRDLDDEDNWTARITGKVDFGGGSDFILAGTFGHIGGNNATSSALWYRVKGMSTKDALKVYANPYIGSSDDDFYNITGILHVDVGPVLMTYEGSRIKFDAQDVYNPSVIDPYGSTGNPSYLWTDYRAKIRSDSHEIRFSNSAPGRLTWVAGANYYAEKIPEKDMNWQVLIQDGCSQPTLDAACYVPNPGIVGTTKHESMGVFGQASYDLTDQIRLTAGGRYSDDSVSRSYTIAAGDAPAGGWLDQNGNLCGPPNYCVNGTDNYGKQSSSKFTWRLGIDFRPVPDQLIYASIATGYKQGGFNDVDPVNGGVGKYGPESLTAYEIGYKGRIASNLQYNTAVYYYDYAKYQLTGSTFLTPSVTGGAPVVLIYTTNPPARFYGWENEIEWRPTRNDDLNLTFALADGEFGKGANVGFIYSNRIDWSGKRPDSLATFSGTASWEHRFPLASGGYIKARAGTKFSNGYYLSDLGGQGNPFTGEYTTLPQQYRQGGFTRTDLTLGYTSENGKLDVTAFVRNIENNLQLVSAPNGMGTGNDDQVFARIADPRTYGIRVGVRF
jgi:iron complex outermembrane receptor protein